MEIRKMAETLEAWDQTTGNLGRLARSRTRAVDFLRGHIDSKGMPTGAGGARVTYYRLPWAFAVSGETELAFRVLSWIEHTGFDSDGRFHGGVEWDPRANATTNTYPETILAYGAVLLRRMDVARRAMEFASQYQDAETGGIYMDRTRIGPDGPQLLFPTAQFGMSAIMAGEIDRAVQVGGWFARLLDAQPAFPDRLLTIWTTANGLSTSAPVGEDRRHYVNESQEERQFHYNGGIAASFLSQLYMHTGNQQWLALARHYQQFSMDSTVLQFNTRQVCKSAWGAGLLYLATRDETYIPWLVRMGNWFVDIQDDDGGWSNTPSLDPNPTSARRVEITAEFVVHLDTVIGALAAWNQGD